MTADTPWTTRPYHRQWLMDQADRAVRSVPVQRRQPQGRLLRSRRGGKTLRQPCARFMSPAAWSIASPLATSLAAPAADAIVDHGMQFLWNGHRDQKHGGYCWSLDDNGYKDDSKQAYGHAFVLLAAADAKVLGHPLADKLLADITEVIETRFWEEQHGAMSEEYARDWSKITGYRGQNSNMHTTEALMAAFEATGDTKYLNMAERIASLIIKRHAAALDYVVAEHFDAELEPRQDLQGLRHVPPGRHDARPLARMVTPSGAALGAGRQETQPGCPKPRRSCSTVR